MEKASGEINWARPSAARLYLPPGCTQQHLLCNLRNINKFNGFYKADSFPAVDDISRSFSKLVVFVILVSEYSAALVAGVIYERETPNHCRSHWFRARLQS